MTGIVDSFTLHIPGPPKGKGRPRFSRHGGRPHTPPETILAEQVIRDAWVEHGAPRLEDGPIQIKVELGVARPKGHYRRDGSLSAEGLRHPYPHKQKPDFDNAVKLIADALNTRAWRDDVQIIDARVIRVWADEPYTGIQASTVRNRVMLLGAATLGRAA